MRRALELARRGAGRVSPNPMVGCVIARGGRVIGEGSLAGVDVWGRATVRLDDARELEIAPEQAELRYV